MTAVECYNQEIKELFNQFQDGEISGNMFHVQRLASLTKANEMFKEQIIDSHEDGVGCIDYGYGIDYYNETFKNTKK